MAITRSRRPIAAARLRTLAHALLDASDLCAIATVSPGGRAHVNTAYFAWSREDDLVWLSAPGAAHSRNVRAGGTVAVAVYDSDQSWGGPDRGVQLFGTAAEAGDDVDAERTYSERFPAYTPADFGDYRFYRFRPRSLKLFDERVLGAGVFVTARVSRGQIAWERTEIYK